MTKGVVTGHTGPALATQMGEMAALLSKHELALGEAARQHVKQAFDIDAATSSMWEASTPSLGDAGLRLAGPGLSEQCADGLPLEGERVCGTGVP